MLSAPGMGAGLPIWVGVMLWANLPLPEIEEIARQALEIGPKHDVAVGSGSSTPEQLRQRQEEGFTFLTYGPDYSLMANAVKAGIDAFKR